MEIGLNKDTTLYNYENNKLVSSVSPEGVKILYLYDSKERMNQVVLREIYL